MPNFATVDELASYLRVDITDPGEQAFAELCIDGASQAIRDFCRQSFDYVADETITLDGTGSDVLLLPELPVIDVSEVIVDFDLDAPRTLVGPGHGSATEYDFDSAAGLLFRRRGQYVLYESRFSAVFGQWPERRKSVQVTYTHGYTTGYDITDVPSSVHIITIAAAARTFAQDGATSETTGAYTAAYAGQPGELTDAERRVLSRYRVRRK